MYISYLLAFYHNELVEQIAIEAASVSALNLLTLQSRPAINHKFIHNSKVVLVQ